MPKSFPLKPLLDLSHTRLDDATRRLGELIANENEGNRKLELLQNYRNEYRERFQDAAREGMGPEAWRNYTAFLARIDAAIDAQASQVDRSRDLTVQGKQMWMNERNRLKAFDTLHTRHIQREAHVLAKQEQRQLDEHTANRHQRKREDHG
ncbi:MAG TPA: flagellar export protein FliJ [Rhodocyclaceae bacterium]|nr:flagellar export protein FliJ [Rhodocyclaceae bacterium]